MINTPNQYLPNRRTGASNQSNFPSNHDDPNRRTGAIGVVNELRSGTLRSNTEFAAFLAISERRVVSISGEMGSVGGGLFEAGKPGGGSGKIDNMVCQVEMRVGEVLADDMEKHVH
ncbi:hypothetical protein E3N88_32124 [Mikania micrantha]|uniref:Uncharacterized protein n=1 Tax=Mikania micrantha TaxID=192012 RepID=A0A5N6M7J1_9ASTR|nr:hypothetical protein E3N88_32124 [Mikania micrantha]